MIKPIIEYPKLWLFDDAAFEEWFSFTALQLEWTFLVEPSCNLEHWLYTRGFFR